MNEGIEGKLPKVVPLPKVGDYTSHVVFGNLGLPVGFDEEQLLVNLRGFQRVQKLAALGDITIHGATGESGTYEHNVDGINGDGSITLRGVAKRQKNPLSQGIVTYPEQRTIYGEDYSSFYNKPDVTIKVNNAETHERIQENSDRFPRRDFDPSARAFFLNKAIRQGLVTASKDANVSNAKVKEGLQRYAIGVAIVYLLGSRSIQEAVALAAASGVGVGFISQVTNSMNESSSLGYSERVARNMRTYRKSLFIGATFDRMIAGSTVASVTRFIKAQS